MTTTTSTTETALRPMDGDDADTVGRILYEAFAAIHDRHRFPRDFPTPEAAHGLVRSFVAHPSIWGVVAEHEGQIVGSNFLDERGPVRGVGPITVDPSTQQRGVGRRLMEAVLDRSAGAAGVRLLQDSFNVRSLGLYASLGFRATEPVVVMGGRPRAEAGVPHGFGVRRMTEHDVREAAALHVEVHGFDRTSELRDALEAPALDPFVATMDGEIAAYASTLTFFPAAHGAARSTAAMRALVAGALAATEAPASFLLPVRQHELFTWALSAGMRVVKPMTYMVIGQEHDPRGAWIPSVLY